ncbi:hypothetical protein HDU84_007756 [Entophlyctis sp. JEL0112]|nr:hypothetical protein HDU84_007756 [Entophlyctis sp. JEL0112]
MADIPLQLENQTIERRTSANGCSRGNIVEVNRRWEEMMRDIKPQLETCGSTEISMTMTAAPIGSPLVDFSNKPKKSISFSENVMYRSLSSIHLDPDAGVFNPMSIWSDEDDFKDEEDDTLYSDESNEWNKDDTLEDIIDGTNVMNLPLDEDNEIIPLHLVATDKQNEEITTNQIPAESGKLDVPVQLDPPICQNPTEHPTHTLQHQNTLFELPTNSDPIVSSPNWKIESPKHAETPCTPAKSKGAILENSSDLICSSLKTAHVSNSDLPKAESISMCKATARNTYSSSSRHFPIAQHQSNRIQSKDVQASEEVFCFNDREIHDFTQLQAPAKTIVEKTQPENLIGLKDVESMSHSNSRTDITEKSSENNLCLDSFWLENSTARATGNSAVAGIEMIEIEQKSDMGSVESVLENSNEAEIGNSYGDDEEIILQPELKNSSSSAFFIPFEIERDVKVSVSDEISVDDETDIKPFITRADPVVVVVSPQSPRSSPNQRSITSDAWEHSDFLSAATTKIESPLLLSKKAIPIRQPDTRISPNIGPNASLQRKIPVVVVKMGEREGMEQMPIRDSNVTLVEDQRNSVRRTSYDRRNITPQRAITSKTQFSQIYMYRDRPTHTIYPPVTYYQTATHRGYMPMQLPKSLSSPELEQPELGKSEQSLNERHISSEPKTREVQPGYRSSYIYRSTSTAYTQESDRTNNSDKRQPEFQSDSSMFRSSCSQYSIPAKTHSASDPKSSGPSRTNRRKQPKKNAQCTEQATREISRPSTMSSTQSAAKTFKRQFRNFLTAPPNSVNSSRATTPSAPPDRTHERLHHCRRISLGSTTSSLRSSLRGIHRSTGSGIIYEDTETMNLTEKIPGTTNRIQSFDSTADSEKRFFPCYRLFNKGIIKQNVHVHHKRKTGIENSMEVVKVVELSDAPTEDTIEIIEGKRSYPSLIQDDSSKTENITEVKRRRFRIWLSFKRWLLSLFEKLFRHRVWNIH